LNEIELMGKLNHKNVLKLYEVYESENSIYLVVDILNGGELLNNLRLNHIHEKGIMHRDLKPENIMLRDENNISDIVIVDFGLSSFIKMDPNNVLFKKCGTPGFIAPEIFQCEMFYSEKCDVFSAGVIFYIL